MIIRIATHIMRSFVMSELTFIYPHPHMFLIHIVNTDSRWY